MLERYTRERQRGQGKKGMFNLEDDDEGFDDEEGMGGLTLTHGGRSVMDLPGDDFVAQGLGDDQDEDDVNIGRRQVARTHFGGFGDDDDEEEVSISAREGLLTTA
jgi:nucleolar protein 14